MEDFSEPSSLKNDAVDQESKVSFGSKITEIHPLAFTIEFDEPKFDESRKSKVRERLSAFTLKHRRNPSLPDFRDVKNNKSPTTGEKHFSSFVETQHMAVLHKKPEKSGDEIQWKSTALKAAKNMELKIPFKSNSGAKENLLKSLKVGRRFSLDGIEDARNLTKPTLSRSGNRNEDTENKSDTVSEAGTYTVDKEDEENEKNQTCLLSESNEPDENEQYLNGMKNSCRRNWINDWVRDVEQQNSLNPVIRKNLTNANGRTKIPSPVNTLTKKSKPRLFKQGESNKVNGAFHKRSSSLSAKDYNENHGSESSLETESYLKATESVMASMQNRMKLALESRSPDLKRIEKRNFNYKERPHPPSTASDTDTNSETDTKTFKKPLGNPFTSARLNRAFSLRRAKADPEKELTRTKPLTNNNEGSLLAKSAGPVAKGTTLKPPASAPFSRLDCGRFSMRSAVSGIRSNLANQVPKKEAKKSNGGNRSSSSLSSREVEFQNWRRRKSFDPMKAAAEGRKKELAKKAAMNNSLTQSVNLGSGTRARSAIGNPVLRSASFHSTAQVIGNEDDEGEFQERNSTDEQEESATSSYLSNPHSRPHNSPSQVGKPTIRNQVFSSRSSLVSETHSSPSRGLRSNDLENLVLSAISEASFKLKLKSCKLLKKLNYLYDPGEEKSFRLRDEIAVLESGYNSSKSSPVHKATSRDLSAILKNLKGVENVFSVLEDVLFDENLEIYVNE